MVRFLAALALIPAVAVAVEAVETPFLRGEGVEDHQRQLHERVHQRPANLVYEGCFTNYNFDSQAIALAHGPFVDAEYMSHQKCRFICEDKLDHPLFMGLSEGNTCWCTEDWLYLNYYEENSEGTLDWGVRELTTDWHFCPYTCVGREQDNCGGDFKAIFLIQIGEWVDADSKEDGPP